MRYVLRRIFHGLILLAAVSALSFLLADLAPGDFLAGVQLDRDVTPETIEVLRDRYGLDEPLALRYLRWLGSILRGDFGFSLTYQVSAGSLLLPRARNTLLLASIALMLSWGTAVPLGVWAAHRPRGLLARAAGGASSFLLATPTIVVGLFFLLLSARVGFLPTGGLSSLDFEGLGWAGRLVDLGRHLALPVLALAIGSFPVLYRHAKAAMEEVVGARFLVAARSQGIGSFRLLFSHALRAAANPLITLLGLSVAGLLSGSLLIEVIMGWPGLGPLLIEAILARDEHVMIGAVLLSSVFLIAGNLLADLMLYWLDPRTRGAS